MGFPADVLTRAFPEPGSRDGPLYPPEFPGHDQLEFHAPDAVGILEFDEPTSEDPPINDVRDALTAIAEDDGLGPTREERDVDASDGLAFYFPYSVHGPLHWGINWIEPALLRETAVVALRAARTAPSLTFRKVARYIREAVRQHELFHFIVEYAAAHVGSQAGTDFYRLGLHHPSRRRLEEPLATAYEMAWLDERRRSKHATTDELKAIKQAWQGAQLPSPYDEWRDAQQHWDRYAEDHAATLKMARAAGHLYRDLLPLLPSTSARDVPERSVGVQQILAGPHAAIWLRLCARPVRLAVRHAERAAREGLPPGVSVERRSKHAVAVVRVGKLRPVPLDPVKWDRLPKLVITELADLFDLTKEQYVNEVLRT